jgi:hypothetical protein
LARKRSAHGQSGADFTTGEWMRSVSICLCTSLAIAASQLLLPVKSGAQAPAVPTDPAATTAAGLNGAAPDAPQPQFYVGGPDAAAQPQSAPAQPQPPPDQQPSAPAQQQPAPAQQQPGQPVPAQSSSSSQPAAQQPAQEKSQREKAEEEVKEQEHQRVEGIIPTFNLTYHHDAVPLSPKQKFELAFRSTIDPFTIASAFVEAGYHEAADDVSGFPWGAKGFGERVGAAYLDTFDGTILSTAIVPIIMRQDPRYFRLGVGTTRHRVLYALASCVIAKNDYNGKWSFNYGNVLGNLAAGGLSNLYYPGGNSGVGLTISTTMIQIAEGAGGSVFNEFWPDMSRKFFHKDPTHGLDAQAHAEYATEQQARKEAKEKKKQQQQPPQPQQQSPQPQQ